MEYSFFSKTAIINELKKNNANIRKSLGQNFLIDPNYVKKIINEVLKSIPKEMKILEIGPGLGALTFYLSQYYKLEVIEIDKVFCKILNETYNDNIVIHNIDYLEFIKLNPLNQYKYIVGNLPYYITTDIMIETVRHINDGICIFLVQKEYAEKLLENNNSISIFLQNFGYIEKLFVVPRNVFFPVPQVESMLIKIQLYSEPVSNPQILEKILRMSFRQKRKKIINSWQNGQELISIETLINYSKKINFDYNKRAEEISKELFYELVKEISLFL